jgi:hypothetical protein
MSHRDAEGIINTTYRDGYEESTYPPPDKTPPHGSGQIIFYSTPEPISRLLSL